MKLQKINGRYYVGTAGISFESLEKAFVYLSRNVTGCDGKHNCVQAILDCPICKEDKLLKCNHVFVLVKNSRLKKCKYCKVTKKDI